MTTDRVTGRLDWPRVVRRRNFRLLWIGETTSELGSNIISVALPLVAVLTLHANAVEVGCLTAAAWLPWLLIGLPAGAWIDRVARRTVMLVADGVSFAMFLSIPLAAWVGVLTFSQLLLVALAGGTARVFFETSYEVYLPSLLDPSELGPGNSLIQGSQSASQVAGPGIAGVMTGLFGAVSGVLLDAVSFLISALCLLSIRGSDDRPNPSGHGELVGEIAEGLRFLFADPLLRAFALFGGLCNLGLVGYQALLVIFLVREIGLGAGLVGLLLAVTSVGGVIGAAAAGAIGRRWGTARGTLGCLTLGCPMALAIPLTGSGWGLLLFLGASLVVVAAIVAGNVLQASWRPLYTPRNLYGRITVSGQLLNYGTIPFGALLAGGLGSALGVRTALWTMTGVVAITPGVLLLSPVRSLHDLPIARERAADAARSSEVTISQGTGLGRAPGPQL